jgi:hypothetical protein
MSEDAKYRLYLQDFGRLVKEYALSVKSRSTGSPTNEEFKRGLLSAYYRVITLMQQQAEGFGIPLAEMGLDDIDPDKDLLWGQAAEEERASLVLGRVYLRYWFMIIKNIYKWKLPSQCIW